MCVCVCVCFVVCFACGLEWAIGKLPLLSRRRRRQDARESGAHFSRRPRPGEIHGAGIGVCVLDGPAARGLPPDSGDLARAFPAWTLLAAVTAYDLKEAAESGKLLAASSYRTLSNGVKGFGTVYLGAKVGAVFFDPSFPQSYHAVEMVPGWATAAILLVGLTLRSDKP